MTSYKGEEILTENIHFELLGKSKLRTKNGEVLWYCQCQCGNLFLKSTSTLKKHHKDTVSCGCIRRHADKLPEGVSAFHRLYRQYKRAAKNRKLLFKLTLEEVKVLSKNTCYYCGKLPCSVIKSERFTGDYVYNGIDRINNTIGYIVDNVVTCCSVCNYMKYTMTVQEFVNQCVRIVEYQKGLRS